MMMYSTVLSLLLITISTSYGDDVNTDANDEFNNALYESMIKWKDSIILEDIQINFKNVNITGWKNMDSGAPTFKISNLIDSNSNSRYVNLTVPAGDIQIDIEEINVGALKIHLWFDIEGALLMMNISSSTDIKNPTDCLLNLDELQVISVTNVIMHSDNKQHEGKNITAAVNMILPFLNILMKSKSFENYLQNAADQVCKVKITGAN